MIFDTFGAALDIVDSVDIVAVVEAAVVVAFVAFADIVDIVDAVVGMEIVEALAVVVVGFGVFAGDVDGEIVFVVFVFVLDNHQHIDD